MHRRVAVTGWHLAAPAGELWQEWTPDVPFLRQSSVSGRLSAGKLFSVPDGESLFEAIATRGANGLAHPGGAIAQTTRERLGVSAVMSKPNFQSFASGCWQMCDAPLVWWQRRLNAAGPGYAPVAACASGAHAVLLGARMIQDNRADAVLCSAWEAPHSEFILAGYRNAGALSKSGVMLPFDERRDGFVPSAGMATLLLESEESLAVRGAQPLAWLRGGAMRGDATAMTAMSPSGNSVSRAIEAACDGLQPTAINAHATATRLNDEMETRAIKQVFGKMVPVSATKPITGHWLGAAGALEAILAVQSLRENWLPPTLGLEQPDGACDLDYISKAGREADVRSVLSLSYGFGGHIGALMFEKA